MFYMMIPQARITLIRRLSSVVCPFFPAKEKLDWQIEDPKGKGLEFFRKVRDEIGEKVKELLK